MEKNIKVCVTGCAGYLASSLVSKLLERGYTVHATLRNIGDPSKAGVLKGLPHADTRLELFEADIYDPRDFDKAIQGCEFVFHLATPFSHDPKNPKNKSLSEATVDGVKSIVSSCIRSGTVKKIIYTASPVATSPLKHDGTGFKDAMDESCWTPLHLSYAYADEHLTNYVHSKLLAEKEVLNSQSGSLDAVTLSCGLVGGDTILPTISESIAMIISQITRDKIRYSCLRFLEEMLGKVPFVHIEDVCEAHIFCMENQSVHGRFLCSRDYLSTSDIASFFPEILSRYRYCGRVQRRSEERNYLEFKKAGGDGFRV